MGLSRGKKPIVEKTSHRRDAHLCYLERYKQFGIISFLEVPNLAKILYSRVTETIV